VIPFLIAIVALWVFVFVPWQCSHVKRQSEYVILSLERMGNPSYTGIARARQISARVQRCLVYMPDDLDLRFEAAASSLVLGSTDAAIEQYREALKIDRRPEIYLNLGTALYNSGRRQEAAVAFARVYAFAGFMVNYDPDLPWSGDKVLDLVPAELREQVIRLAERDRALLGRRR
jgi:tetratricopeptide (TPR) repeat protein